MTYSKVDYKFVRFVKSDRKGKKYKAILKNKQTGREVGVHFGAIKPDGTPYEQYKDSTGLGLYTRYNHNDKQRRKRYHERHKKDNLTDYTPGYFAYHFLW